MGGWQEERGPGGAKMPNYAIDLSVSDANFEPYRKL